MNFTVWALCAIVAAAQGLFLAAILFSKKENHLPNRLLGAMLLLLAVTLTEWALWWTGLIKQVPVLKAMSFGFPLLYGPLMFLYYRAALERKPLNTKTLWHFLPFAIAVFLMLPFYLRFFENIAASLTWIPALTRRPWFPIPVFAQMIGYGIWIGIRFKKHFLNNVALRWWHRWLLLAYWGIVSAYLLYRLLPYIGLTAPEWTYLVAFSLTLFIYLAAWLGYIEPRVFDGMPLRQAIALGKYHKSSLKAENSDALFRQVINLMEQENLYQENQLTLDFLSEKMGKQRHHLSQAINKESGKTFSEFVNNYRVQAAQRLLETTTKKELNVIEVAYKVGFNSKKAFNLVFKKHTGMTPTEFRKAQEKRTTL